MRHTGPFTEEQARFYFSEVLLALEYLHSLDIIYRDLKPENVLLDEFGHVRLADFGSAKAAVSASTRCSSFAGSPEYMSPEMLQGRGYTRAVDLYSLGVLLYEMLAGFPPFTDRSRANLYRKILTTEPVCPSNLSPSCCSLIFALLTKDPSQRLGHKHSFFDIKTHPWMQGVPWDRLKALRKASPLPPNRYNSSFEPGFTALPLDLPDCDTPVVSRRGSLIEDEENIFDGIEYMCKKGSKDINRLSKSADFTQKLSPESTKSTLKELPSLSLADKIRQLRESLEPAVPSSLEEETWQQDFKSPRFRGEIGRTKGPVFSPCQPVSKQKRRERRGNGSFGGSVGTVSEEES